MAQTIPAVRNDALVLRDRDGERVIAVGTPAWYAWLLTASSCSFASPLGTFTALRERRARGGWYWKAYRKRSGKLHRAYLGVSKLLTLGRLNEVAAALANTETGDGPLASASTPTGEQPLLPDVGSRKPEPAHPPILGHTVRDVS